MKGRWWSAISDVGNKFIGRFRGKTCFSTSSSTDLTSSLGSDLFFCLSSLVANLFIDNSSLISGYRSKISAQKADCLFVPLPVFFVFFFWSINAYVNTRNCNLMRVQIQGTRIKLQFFDVDTYAYVYICLIDVLYFRTNVFAVISSFFLIPPRLQKSL